MYEPMFKDGQSGVLINYFTNRREYNPLHWHSAIELIYVLTGTALIKVENKEIRVAAGEFIVIDTNQLHEFRYENMAMVVVLHFSRKNMREFVPSLHEYSFACRRDDLKEVQYEPYIKTCKLLMELPLLHVTQPLGYEIRSQAVAMAVFYELLNYFTYKIEADGPRTEKEDVLKRMGEIAAYIDCHYAEPISLEEIASHFYLSREYFSRFFKKHMGITFSQYLNEVRMAHVYSDIRNTRTGIMELAERHGFASYKLFNQMFRATYGCTPRQVRQGGSEEE